MGEKFYEWPDCPHQLEKSLEGGRNYGNKVSISRVN